MEKHNPYEALEHLTPEQLAQNLRAYRKSGKWDKLSPAAANHLRKRFEAAMDYLLAKDQHQAQLEGVTGIQEEAEEHRRMGEDLRKSRSLLTNILSDFGGGVLSLPSSAARVGGFALDRLWFPKAGAALTEYAQDVDDMSNVLYPPPSEDAGWGETLGHAALSNLPPMLATGFGTKALLPSAAALGKKAVKAVTALGAGVGMSAPEIIRDATTFDELGKPILPKKTLPIIAGTLAHGAIETGLGFTPASLVTKGKGKFLQGLFAKDTVKRISTLNKRYGSAKTALIVAKRIFKDTPIGNAIEEGIEEVFQNPVTVLSKNFANYDTAEALSRSIDEMGNLGYLKELGEEFAVGAGVGLIYGGGRTVIDKIDNAIESKKTPFEDKQKLAQEKEVILETEEIEKEQFLQLEASKQPLLLDYVRPQPQVTPPEVIELPPTENLNAPERLANASPIELMWAVVRAKARVDQDFIAYIHSIAKDRQSKELLSRANDEGVGLKNGNPFPTLEIAKKFIDKSSFKADMVVLPHSSGKGFVVAPDVAGEQFKQMGSLQAVSSNSMNDFSPINTGSTPAQFTQRPLSPQTTLKQNAAIKDIKTGAMEASKPAKELESKPVEQKKGAIGKLSERINQFIEELKGKNLTPEQQGIYDVFTRKEKIYKIQDLKEVGEYVKPSQGKRNYGAKHILIKHYGTNITPVTPAEIVQIGEVIRTGKVDFEEDGRVYIKEAKDGAILRLVVKKDKQGDNTVFTFHAKNRKAPMRATEGTSDLQGAFQKAETSATSSIPTSGGGVKGAEKARKVGRLEAFLEYERECRENLLKEGLANIESSARTDAEKKMLRKYLERAYKKKYIGQSTLAKANKLLEGIKSKDIEAFYRVDTRSDEAARVMFEAFIGRRLRRKEARGVIEEYFKEAIDKSIAERKARKEASNKPAVSERKIGDFGPIFDEYSNDLKGAIEILSKEKTGEVPRVLHHKDVGAIDLVWGKEGTGRGDGFGLSKIIKFHPEVVDNLQKVLDDTEIKQKSDNRVVLESQKFKGIVSLNYFKNEKKWLLSAYEKEESLSKKTIDTLETDKISKEDDKLSSNRLNPSIPTSDDGVKGAEKVDTLPYAEDIDKELARRAHMGTSFDPENRGDSEIAGYVKQLQNVKEELLGLAETEEQKAIAEEKFQQYRKKYKDLFESYLSSRTRVMSTMITGPANFPVARNRKVHESVDNKLKALQEFHKTFMRRAKKDIIPDTSGRILSGEADALTRLREQLAEQEAKHEQMKQANDILRRKKLTDAEKIAKLQELGYKEYEAGRLLRGTEHIGHVGYPSYAITGSNARIKRLKERIIHESRIQKQATAEVSFDGGKIVDSVEDNRLQIIYDSKPDGETITKLKKNGFRWAPSKGAWQAYRNDSSRRKALEITGTKIPRPDTKLYSVEYLVAKYTAKVFNAGWRLFKVTAGNFAKWARVMVAELGNSIKPKLRGLYKDLREFSMFNARNARRGAISFKDVDKKPEPVVLKSVSEMTDEDFINPSRSILLPSLPDNTLKIIGSEKKPVLIKQNILEKNKLNHKELTAEDSRKILNTALYSPDLIGRGKAQTKPSYWVAVKLGSKNAVVVIDITETKGNHEIVGWRMIDEKGLANMKKQAEREDGQFLITKSENTQGAADRLSALPPDLSTPSIPKTETEVKPADKKTRLVKPKDFQWEKIDKDTYQLQFTDPDNGDIETVATLVRNKTGKGSHKWNWVGKNNGFLDAVSAKSVVKSRVFEKIKRSKYEQRKAKRIAAREMDKEEKKLEKAQEYIEEGDKKPEPEEALPKTLKEKIDYFLERAEEMLFDIWAPVRRLQEKIEKEGEKLSDDLNLYDKLQLISGKIEENVKETKAKYFDPIIKILIENKINLKDFNWFLYVSHAPERNDAIAKIPNNPFALTGEPGSGISTEQANEELKKFKALPNYDAYVKAAELTYELNNFLLDEQVRLGTLSQKQRDAYRKYQKYTPLKSPPDQGFVLDRVALGRRSKASEQLSYIEQAVHATYSRAYRQEIAGTAIKLFSLFPNNEMYERVKPKLVQYIDKNGKTQIKQAMDKFFGNPEMIWAKDTETKKYTVFRIKDKSLREAVISTQKDDSIEKKTYRFLARINRWLAGVATAFNLEFIYTNLIRDVQQGAAGVEAYLPEGSVKKFLSNLKRSKQAIADSRAGKVTEDTKMLKEFLLGGGMTGYSEFMKLENRAAEIESEVSSGIKGGTAYNVKQGFKKAFGFIEAWNEAIETRTRFAGYITAKEAGFSVQKAAAFAKNMTVNFNKKGSWAPVLNSLFLFSSANLGGSLVTANLLVKANKTAKGRKMIASAIALGFAAEIINSMIAGDDDEDGENYYNKVPDYVKDFNYIFMIPGGKGKYVSIPMAYGLNVLPSIGRNIAASMLGNQTGKDGVVNIIGSVMDAFNPLGGDRRSVPYHFVPTAFRPFVDVATNTTWTGRKIRPEQDAFGSKVANSELYYAENSKLIRDASKFLNEFFGGDKYTSSFVDYLTPGEIEHLLQSATGGVGKMLTRSLDLVTKDKEELSLNTVPIMRRFLGSTTDYNTFEAFRENTELVKDFERAKRERNFEWLDKNRWLMVAAERLKRTQKVSTAVNKSNLPDIQKRKRLLQEQKDFNKYFEQLKSKALSKN